MAVVLVVGSASSGKRTLVQAVVSSLEAGGAESSQCITPTEANANTGSSDSDRNLVLVSPQRQEDVVEADALFDVYPLTIKTKYYSVQIELWRQAQPVSVLGLRCAELEGLEGIIVVFDLTEAASFEEVEEWTAFVEAKEACTFRVCVGSKMDLSPAVESTGSDGDTDTGLEERRRRCLAWCLDHGFEYVEADCRDPLKGGDSREKEGVPRVVESLESNLWNNMEFRTQSRPSAALMSRAARPRSTDPESAPVLGDRGHVDLGARDADALEDGDEEEGASGDLSEHATRGTDAYGGDPAALGYGVLESDDESADVAVDGDGHGDPHDSATSRPLVEENVAHVALRAGVGTDGGHSRIGPGHLKLQARWESSARESEGIFVQPADPANVPKDATANSADNMSGPGNDGFDCFEGPVATSDPGSLDVDRAHDVRTMGAEPARHAGTSTARIGEGARRELTGVDSIANGTMGGDHAPASRGEIHPEDSEPIGVAEIAPVYREVTPNDHAAEEQPRTGSRGDAESREPPPASEEKDQGEGATLMRVPTPEVASDGGDQGPRHEERSSSSAGAESGVDAAESLMRNLGIVDDSDEVEWLMSEVRKAREHGSSLPDNERRARAANVAMRLATLIGEADDSEED